MDLTLFPRRATGPADPATPRPRRGNAKTTASDGGDDPSGLTDEPTVDAAAAPAPAGHILSERFVDPDLVDRIFEYILSELPELAGRATEVKRQVRAEFAGEGTYIARRGAADRHATARQVLSMFNGRNASEVARILGIGRTTVYRVLKQAGGGDVPMSGSQRP